MIRQRKSSKKLAPNRSRTGLAVGCDIVYLPRFKKAISLGGQIFLEKIFHPSELKRKETIHLAGIFAAKEAAMKVLKLKSGDWLKIEVVYQKNGKPTLKFIREAAAKIKEADLSISHDGDYAISVFVAILK